MILTVHMHHITNCSGLTEDLLQVWLGLAIDSEDMTDSLKIAEEKGVAIDFVIEEKDNKEPNYAYLDLESENGFKLKLGTTSIGGGAIEIIEIDGYPICIRGDFNTLFLYVNDKVDEVKKSAEQIIGGQCTVKELKKDAECLLCIETREFLRKINWLLWNRLRM